MAAGGRSNARSARAGAAPVDGDTIAHRYPKSYGCTAEGGYVWLRFCDAAERLGGKGAPCAALALARGGGSGRRDCVDDMGAKAATIWRRGGVNRRELPTVALDMKGYDDGGWERVRGSQGRAGAGRDASPRLAFPAPCDA